jgi:hypothetical protein
VTDALAVTGRPGAADRPDRRRAAPARQGRPAGQDADHATGRGPVHRPGHAGRDRGYHPLRKRPQAGQLGRADPGGPRLGPGRPARAHPGQGSAWLRRVLNQAAQSAKRSPEFAATYEAIAQRRGTKIATIAIARKLLTSAWHLLATQAPAPACQRGTHCQDGPADREGHQAPGTEARPHHRRPATGTADNMGLSVRIREGEDQGKPPGRKHDQSRARRWRARPRQPAD